MVESHGCRAARLAGTELGEATITSEDDALVIHGSLVAEPVRIEWRRVARVSVAGSVVRVRLDDGRELDLVAVDPRAIAAGILSGCRGIPELTRGLRSLGRSVRGEGGAQRRRDEAEFFTPLLSARRVAAEAPADRAIAAFSAERLRASIERTLATYAAARAGDRPSLQRALEAEMTDAAQPLWVALDALAVAATDAAADVDDLQRWRSWVVALQGIFVAADRSWGALQPVLAEPVITGHGSKRAGSTPRSA